MGNFCTKSEKLPTATFAVTDRLAIGAMSYLKEHGIKVPNNMAIAGIGNSEISQYLDPPLTTIDYKNEEAGTEAAKKILSVIHEKNSNKKIVLDYGLIIRDSV
ncbi:substrate-binding domain-containing protein [Lentibacillus salicampi]|nr:substrate-binding domain-containing protein [Lentibacillus salicampi]